MSIEKLRAKKDELIKEIQQQKLNEKDIEEIEQEVKEYKEYLLEERNNEYEDKRKLLSAKIELLDELIKAQLEETSF